jgi:hypothetical protein
VFKWEGLYHHKLFSVAYATQLIAGVKSPFPALEENRNVGLKLKEATSQTTKFYQILLI